MPFCVATNFTKLKIILFLKCWRKNIYTNFQRIIKLFTQKIVTKFTKIWVWDPGSRSGIRKKPNPDPGSMGQKGSGSRIRILNTAIFGFKIPVLGFSIVVGNCWSCFSPLWPSFAKSFHWRESTFFKKYSGHSSCLQYRISCMLTVQPHLHAYRTVQHLLHAYCTASPAPCTVHSHSYLMHNHCVLPVLAHLLARLWVKQEIAKSRAWIETETR